MSHRIGLVTGEFPPMEGGVGAFTQELAHALYSLGHELHIITSYKARPSDTKRTFWEPKKPIDLGFALLHPIINRWWWASTSKVADVVLENEIQIVNIQYQAAAFSMHVPAINFLPWRLRNVAKTVVTFHDLRHPYLFPKAGSLRQTVVLSLARLSDGIIVTNNDDFRELANNSIDEKPFEEIPIGSNIVATIPAKKSVEQVRRDLKLSEDDMLLGFFGFVNESKGADLLIEALNGLPNNIHLVFIGAHTGASDSKNTQHFRELLLKSILKFGLEARVHWSGYLSDDDVSRYMHAADLLVMPYRDGVSLRRGTLMATLAHGRPLVTTSANRPIPELIHGQNVWMVEVDQPASLREAITKLLTATDLRQKIGEGAFELAQLFTWDKIALRSVSFYDRVLSKK